MKTCLQQALLELYHPSTTSSIVIFFTVVMFVIDCRLEWGFPSRDVVEWTQNMH